jgi:hypothetical protein
VLFLMPSTRENTPFRKQRCPFHFFEKFKKRFSIYWKNSVFHTFNFHLADTVMPAKPAAATTTTKTFALNTRETKEEQTNSSNKEIKKTIESDGMTKRRSSAINCCKPAHAPFVHYSRSE